MPLRTFDFCPFQFFLFIFGLVLFSVNMLPSIIIGTYIYIYIYIYIQIYIDRYRYICQFELKVLNSVSMAGQTLGSGFRLVIINGQQWLVACPGCNKVSYQLISELFNAPAEGQNFLFYWAVLMICCSESSVNVNRRCPFWYPCFPLFRFYLLVNTSWYSMFG